MTATPQDPFPEPPNELADRRASSSGFPVRRFFPHYGAAALAAIGAALFQLHWPAILAGDPFESWWPVDALLVVAASVYLLALAEIHIRCAHWRQNELVPRLWLLGQTLGTNGLFVLLFGIAFMRGPQSYVLRAGLWTISPGVMVAAGVSAAVIVWALVDGWRRFFQDIPSPDAPDGKPQRARVYNIAAAALFFALVAVGYVEPDLERESPPRAHEAVPGEDSHEQFHDNKSS
jgi:hypothetical protein